MIACSGLSSTACAPCSRPVQRDELAQVAEVADAPRALRVQRVELQHPAPRPRRLRQRGRCHDDGDVAAELLVDQLEPVVAGVEVVGQLGDVDPRALGDRSARPDRAAGGPRRRGARSCPAARPAPPSPGRGPAPPRGPPARPRRRRAGRAPDDDVVVDLDEPAFTVAVGGGDAVRGGQLDQVGVHGPIVPRRPARHATGCGRSLRARPEPVPAGVATPAQTTTTLSAPSRCSHVGVVEPGAVLAQVAEAQPGAARHGHRRRPRAVGALAQLVAARDPLIEVADDTAAPRGVLQWQRERHLDAVGGTGHTDHGRLPVARRLWSPRDRWPRQDGRVRA